ncbi:MAG: hypothetical protein PHT48_11440 [Dechloromonas sp.]|nr:hypothetical protein [Dechloromonas sp.]
MRPSPNEIASFPELFTDLEQFIDEQASHLKRASSVLAGLALGLGALALLIK